MEYTWHQQPIFAYQQALATMLNKCMTCFGIVATSSFVTGYGLYILFEDDWLPRQLQLLSSELSDEVELVENISTGAWQALAPACRTTASDL